MPWLGRGSSRVSSVPFILFIFLAFGSLTLRCGTELEKEASKATEASRVEVQRWKEKSKGKCHRPLPLFDLSSFRAEPHPARFVAGLEKEVSQVAEASVVVQATLEAEIEEHDALQAAARTICEALAVEGA